LVVVVQVVLVLLVFMLQTAQTPFSPQLHQTVELAVEHILDHHHL
jgi:hypothetical protein